MTDQDDVIESLEADGVLECLRWAGLSASSQTLSVYSEAAGHDATWLGLTQHTHLRDRLDRVFGCKRYTRPPAGSDDQLDVVQEALSDQAVATWPTVEPDLVIRHDLNGSPGWVVAGVRFLLASYTPGKLDQLPWAQKSMTKQKVALQPTHCEQPSLFTALADGEIAGSSTLLMNQDVLDMPTLVLAHSLDPITGGLELALGSPRMNSLGGPAWHWREVLLATPPASGGTELPTTPLPPSPDTEPDAAVRLRRPAAHPAADATEDAG